jgi:hypothetical protein
MRPKIPEILCGMGDCTSIAIKNIELVDDITKKDIELPCCLSHALIWEIMWVFTQAKVDVDWEDVENFVKKLKVKGMYEKQKLQTRL